MSIYLSIQIFFLISLSQLQKRLCRNKFEFVHTIVLYSYMVLGAGVHRRVTHNPFPY